jgi:hypothetical protein
MMRAIKNVADADRQTKFAKESQSCSDFPRWSGAIGSLPRGCCHAAHCRD